MVRKKARRKTRKAPTTLNHANLRTLGTSRLADLLIELTQRDPAGKRLLRLALAVRHSPAAVARVARPRLRGLARARSRMDTAAGQTAARDLAAILRAVRRGVAETDPALALDLLWLHFQATAATWSRSSGVDGVWEIRDEVLEWIPEVAARAKPDPIALADAVVEALSHWPCYRLLEDLGPHLGNKGLAHLKTRVENDFAQWSRLRALRAVADAMGDVDAFISTFPEEDRSHPDSAAAIGERLSRAGRHEEALEMLARVGDGARVPIEWFDARIAALEGLDRKADADADRWQCFTTGLSRRHLREWLKQFDAFDEMDAEERAFDRAERHPDIHAVLMFFLDWPDHGRAASFVVRNAEKLDGNRWDLLTEGAAELAARFPLAATLMLRAVIEFTLRETRTRDYRAAAQHFGECSSLAAQIPDFRRFPDHATYRARLKRKHAFALRFWKQAAPVG